MNFWLIELDLFMGSESLASRLEKVEVVEEYSSKPHKLVRSEVRLAGVYKWKRKRRCRISCQWRAC